MPSLADIAPSIETVEVRGEKYQVHGLEIGDIAALFMRFPEIRAMVEAGKFDLPAVLKLEKRVTAAIIAAGLGKLGDEAEEAGAANLALSEKATFIASILRQTMPTGIGPFVEAMAVLAPAEIAKAADGAVKLRSKKSPSSPSG